LQADIPNLVPQLSLTTMPAQQSSSEHNGQSEQPAIHSSDNNLMGPPAPPVRRVSRFQVSVVTEGKNKSEDGNEPRGTKTQSSLNLKL